METSKVTQFLEGFDIPTEQSNVRKEALMALGAMDFPTTRVEDWKYTRTTKITTKKFTQQQTPFDISGLDLIEGEMHRLIFINGYFDEKQSCVLTDDAIQLQSIHQLNEEAYAEAIEDTEENVFSLINKAYYTDGVCLTVKKNKRALYPIHIIHIITGEQVIANTRHFFELEEGSQAEVFCSYNSSLAENSFTNMVMEGHIATNAKLTIQKVQAEDRNVFHLSHELFIQDKSSQLEINTITTGGLLVRNGLNVLVDGENCHTELNGIYLGKEKQHLDNHTFVDHLHGHCTSSETYKGVMDDQATGVFNGKVVVRKDAQKIEAYQSNGNILLSNKATTNSKPELEIYADDVRCSHGSTTGQLDENAVYYLRSRGLSEKSARQLLVTAFIGEVLDKIDHTAVRSYIDRLFLKEYNWEF